MPMAVLRRSIDLTLSTVDDLESDRGRVEVRESEVGEESLDSEGKSGMEKKVEEAGESTMAAVELDRERGGSMTESEESTV